jgi:hypothetical protein
VMKTGGGGTRPPKASAAWCALKMETSCSTERPPNKTATVCLGIREVRSSGGAPDLVTLDCSSRP